MTQQTKRVQNMRIISSHKLTDHVCMQRGQKLRRCLNENDCIRQQDEVHAHEIKVGKMDRRKLRREVRVLRHTASRKVVKKLSIGKSNDVPDEVNHAQLNKDTQGQDTSRADGAGFGIEGKQRSTDSAPDLDNDELMGNIVPDTPPHAPIEKWYGNAPKSNTLGRPVCFVSNIGKKRVVTHSPLLKKRKPRV